MHQLPRKRRYFLKVVGVMSLLVIGYISAVRSEQNDKVIKVAPEKNTEQTSKAKTATAIFAGGCFWCVESDFDKVKGVLKTTSGYTGGKTENPTYKEVTYKNTGHFEAVEITYDPSIVTYKQLLHSFWRTVDPTDAGGQFCDRGASYRTAIFPTTEEQWKIAKESKVHEQTKGKLKGKIVTPILKTTMFYKAEGYHQNYYKTNPVRYNYYRYSCGRDQRIKKLWGNEAHSGLKKLTH
jgi:peptide-methionine (S)-S-oxide reductase